jgi:hypothetical protein
MSTDAVHHVSFREIDSVFAGWSEPATASISRPVSTADIGDERSPATGCSARVALICGRRSGEALRTSQYARWPSPQAKPATARSRHLPARPGTQMRCSSTAGNTHRPQTEHKPYQHGLPRRLRRAPKAKRLLDLSASVRVDLQPHRDLDDDGCLPLHCCIPRSDSCRWQKWCSAAAAPQWKVGEPRDRGLAIGNRSRRWRPSPPHWY